MSEQGFRGVPGVPFGWELVRIGVPSKGDYYLDGQFGITEGEIGMVVARPIVRKIEKQKQYRPFANAEEFKPHRDRWWKEKTKSYVYPPSTYSDNYHCGSSWSTSFIDKLFDDGTPFGVEVTE